MRQQGSSGFGKLRGCRVIGIQLARVLNPDGGQTLIQVLQLEKYTDSIDGYAK
jgi:hypothetical protein